MNKAVFKVLAIFLISLFLFTANVVASGYIIIDSIAGIKIFIDDQYVGITEEGDMIIEKPAGDYELQAKKTGYYQMTINTEVEDFESSLVKLEMERADILTRGLEEEELAALGIKTGSLLIRSVPYTGGDIWLEGQYAGETNNMFNQVLAGEINVEISINDEIAAGVFNLKENEEKELLAHYGMKPPQVIELFQLGFAGNLPEDYFIEIQGEHRTVNIDEIGKTIRLMGAKHTIRINNGSDFLDYQKNIDLKENNYIDDLPLPAHYLNMVFVEAGSTAYVNGGLEIENSFYISKYHVTQSDFEQIMGFNPSRFKGKPDNPVDSVSWYDSVMFCNNLSEKEGLDPYYNISQIEYYGEHGKLGGHPNNIKSAIVTGNREANGYRLPTKDEHEYAARGGADGEYTTYAGSDNLDEAAWYWKNSGDEIFSKFPVYTQGEFKGLTDVAKLIENNNRTHPVGQKKPNELGLYDMVGNVWDWTNSYLKAEPDDLFYRRGGSYKCFNDFVDIFNLKYDTTSSPDARYSYYGFRLVRSF